MFRAGRHQDARQPLADTQPQVLHGAQRKRLAQLLAINIIQRGSNPLPLHPGGGIKNTLHRSRTRLLPLRPHLHHIARGVGSLSPQHHAHAVPPRAQHTAAAQLTLHCTLQFHDIVQGCRITELFCPPLQQHAMQPRHQCTEQHTRPDAPQAAHQRHHQSRQRNHIPPSAGHSATHCHQGQKQRRTLHKATELFHIRTGFGTFSTTIYRNPAP